MYRRETLVWIITLTLSVIAPSPSRSDHLCLHVTHMSGVESCASYENIVALEQLAFEAKTPWTKGVDMYSGPSLRDFLELYGITLGSVKLTALNDYSVTMDLSKDIINDKFPILAIKINGHPIPIRENGPYWVMYPLDDMRIEKPERIYALSIWHLTSITQLSNGDK